MRRLCKEGDYNEMELLDKHFFYHLIHFLQFHNENLPNFYSWCFNDEISMVIEIKQQILKIRKFDERKLFQIRIFVTLSKFNKDES